MILISKATGAWVCLHAAAYSAGVRKSCPGSTGMCPDRPGELPQRTIGGAASEVAV